MSDKTRIILVEGKTDTSFIKWILEKNNIILGSNQKLVEVYSKTQFEPHIKGIVTRYKVPLLKDSSKEYIDYNEYDIEKILIIKDCDLDDNRDKETAKYKKIAEHITLDCQYIYGETDGTLESFIITNNGIRLKLFKQYIGQFESYAKNQGCSEPKLEKIADKQIFESYLKFTVGKINYDYNSFDKLLDHEKLSKTPEVERLIKLITEF
jgi:5S rRNA maturation endonuclease (ribonuclease M5)